MLLGMARGSVGDVTFARSARKQVSRARNRRPNNPRSLAQIRQRILLKTASLAYSVLAKDFADQTFEGAADARENQQRFIRANVKNLRDNLSTTGGYRYATKDSVNAPLSYYIISQGSLVLSNLLSYGHGQYAFVNEEVEPLVPVITTFSYKDAADYLGVPAGSQLTFIDVDVDQTTHNIIRVSRARLILAPSDGDVTKLMFSAADTLNDPNPANEGIKSVTTTGGLVVTTDNDFTCGGVVASHFDRKWRYSSNKLFFSSPIAPNNFDEAVESWASAGSRSEEYTRQAE